MCKELKGFDWRLVTLTVVDTNAKLAENITQMHTDICISWKQQSEKAADHDIHGAAEQHMFQYL